MPFLQSSTIERIQEADVFDLLGTGTYKRSRSRLYRCYPNSSQCCCRLLIGIPTSKRMFDQEVYVCLFTSDSQTGQIRSAKVWKTPRQEYVIGKDGLKPVGWLFQVGVMISSLRTPQHFYVLEEVKGNAKGPALTCSSRCLSMHETSSLQTLKP